MEQVQYSCAHLLLSYLQMHFADQHCRFPPTVKTCLRSNSTVTAHYLSGPCVVPELRITPTICSGRRERKVIPRLRAGLEWRWWTRSAQGVRARTDLQLNARDSGGRELTLPLLCGLRKALLSMIDQCFVRARTRAPCDPRIVVHLLFPARQRFFRAASSSLQTSLLPKQARRASACLSA